MRSVWAVTLLAVLAACGGETPAPAPAPAPKVEAPTPVPPPPTPKMPAPAAWTLPEGAHPALLDPGKANEPAPEKYRVKFQTTEGDFVVEVDRANAPIGAARFYNLARIGFYDNAGFFRAIDGFMVQFGISAYPDVTARWREATIIDDPVKGSNKRGTVTFATSGPDSRTTQIFINLVDNGNLDGMGFAPFGKVVEGMEVVDKLYMGYGEGAPRGRGPHQGKLQTGGNAYLEREFPELDYVKTASIVP
jgi:peptidyl-prolyl cis-trans isomerase A (cyclophilin A)